MRRTPIARVLDGLAGAASVSPELGHTLQRLAPRLFVMRDAHAEQGTVLLQPRWMMSFMRGPMTRSEIQRALAARHPKGRSARLVAHRPAADMGLLILHGILRLDQFWPKGSLDADTSKVKPLRFTYDGVPTTVFDGAIVQGRGLRVPVFDRNGEVTVRYQGIDARELHYQPRSSHGRRLDFRQYSGESATVVLYRKLKSFADKRDGLTCEVHTEVDHPNEVFDVYGRFIGDVWVAAVNLNLWLATEGWAFPTFYASMHPQEIRQLQRASKHAADRKVRIWSTFSEALTSMGGSCTAGQRRTAPRSLNPPGTMARSACRKCFAVWPRAMRPLLRLGRLRSRRTSKLV